jgi:putative FmdB family regulatory protein
MPLYDYLCLECKKTSEILVSHSKQEPSCPLCGSSKVKKMLSAPSSLTGATGHKFPGPGDTACCGSSPMSAGCAGPGSCCGKAHA